MFPSSGEVRDTPTLLGPLKRADTNQVHKPSDSEFYTPSSEPFRSVLSNVLMYSDTIH
jgi:hypothetical protein